MKTNSLSSIPTVSSPELVTSQEEGNDSSAGAVGTSSEFWYQHPLLTPGVKVRRGAPSWPVTQILKQGPAVALASVSSNLHSATEAQCTNGLASGARQDRGCGGGRGKSAWWTGAVRASLVTDQQGWKNENANIISVSGQIRSPAMRSRHMHGCRDTSACCYTHKDVHMHAPREKEAVTPQASPRPWMSLLQLQ